MGKKKTASVGGFDDPIDEEDEEKRKKQREDLINSEKKFQDLLSRRNEAHDEALMIRNERDTLHDERKGLMDEIRDTKEKRDTLVAKMREHKRLRNEYQKKAKALIEAKKKKAEGMTPTLVNDIEALNIDIRLLEQEFETKARSFDKEKEIMDKIKERKREMDKLIEKEPQQKMIESKVTSIEERIDELFKLADKEHEEVVRLFDESQKYHEMVDSSFKEISHLLAEANKKHKEFIDLNERANTIHQKAMTMREKVMSIRSVQKARREESRKLIDDQNKAVQEIFEDEERIDDIIDEALDILKSKGKLSLK